MRGARASKPREQKKTRQSKKKPGPWPIAENRSRGQEATTHGRGNLLLKPNELGGEPSLAHGVHSEGGRLGHDRRQLNVQQIRAHAAGVPEPMNHSQKS